MDYSWTLSNLPLTFFFARHKNHTSWSVDYSDITVPKMCALKKQLEMESGKEKNHEAPTIDLKDISKTYEAIIQYLRGIRRCDGVPINYVARPTSDIISIEDACNRSNTYATYDEEMVKRVPIIDPGHAASATE